MPSPSPSDKAIPAVERPPIDENVPPPPTPFQYANRGPHIPGVLPLTRNPFLGPSPFTMPGGRSQTPNSRIRTPVSAPDDTPLPKRPRTAASVEQLPAQASSRFRSRSRRLDDDHASSSSQRIFHFQIESDAERMLRLGIPFPEETNIIGHHHMNGASGASGSDSHLFFSPSPPHTSSSRVNSGGSFNWGFESSTTKPAPPSPSTNRFTPDWLRTRSRKGSKLFGPRTGRGSFAPFTFTSRTAAQIEDVEEIGEPSHPRFISKSPSPNPFAPKLSSSPLPAKSRSMTSLSGSATLSDHGSPQPPTRNGTPYPHSDGEDGLEIKHEAHRKDVNAEESNAEAEMKLRHFTNGNRNSSEVNMPGVELDRQTAESKASQANGTSPGFSAPLHPNSNPYNDNKEWSDDVDDFSIDDFPMGSDEDEYALHENNMSPVDHEPPEMRLSFGFGVADENSPMGSDEDADGLTIDSDEAADGSSMDSDEDADDSSMDSDEDADGSSMDSDEDADGSSMDSDENADGSQQDDESDIGVYDSSDVDSNMHCDCRTCRWERGDSVSDSMDEDEDEDDLGEGISLNHPVIQLREEIATASKTLGEDDEEAVAATCPTSPGGMADDAVGLKNALDAPPSSRVGSPAASSELGQCDMSDDPNKETETHDVNPGVPAKPQPSSGENDEASACPLSDGPSNKDVMALLTTLNDNTVAQAASHAAFVTTVTERLDELAGTVKRMSERQDAEAAAAEQLRVKVNKIGSTVEKLSTLADKLGAGSQKVIAAADTIKEVMAKLRVLGNVGAQVDGMDEAILRVEQQITALGMFLTGKVVRNTASVTQNGLQIQFDALHNRLNNQDEAINGIAMTECECDGEETAWAIGEVETRLAGIEEAIGAGANPHPTTVCGMLKAHGARMEANFKY